MSTSAAPLENTSSLPAGDAIHAGFWRRSAALAADALILSPLFVAAVYIPIFGLSLLLLLAGGWLYWALLESSPWQATAGKRMMGIKVVDNQGRRIGFGRATGRHFSKFVTAVIPFYIGWLLAGLTERKQALHDMMTSTLVVFNAVRPGQPLPVKRPPMPWYGWVLNVMPFASPFIIVAVALTMNSLSGALGIKEIDRANVTAMSVAGEIYRGGCQTGSRPPKHQWLEKVEVLETSDGGCTITLLFGASQDIPGPARHEKIYWTRGKSGNLTCTSTLPYMYRPENCSAAR